MKPKNLVKTLFTTAGAMHCINKFIESSFIDPSKTKNSGKYYHWKHGDIYYKKAGSGSPLLLIHDLTVHSSSYEWSRVINQLSSSHTVYTIDLIGCGKSDKPSITYTNYFYVQMITDFIEDVICKKTDVAVTGLSSSFVIMANKLNKNLFDTIFLINPTPISLLKKVPSEHSKLFLRLFEIPVFSKSVFYFFTSKFNTEHYLTETCFYNPFNLKPSIIKAYYNASHAGNGNGKHLLSSLLGYYVNVDISAALANAENDIILIAGSNDVHKKETEETYSIINPNIIYKIINKSNHLPHLECPNDFIHFIKNF